MVLFLFVFNLILSGLIFPHQAKAVFPTFDSGAIMATISQTIKDGAQWVATRSEKMMENSWEYAKNVAAKAALQNFLRNLAIETATWISTGDKGNKPLIFTSDWPKYLKNASDQLTGDFISAMATEWGNDWDQLDSDEEAYDNLGECEKKCELDFTDLLSEGEKACKEDCTIEWQLALDEAEKNREENKSKFSAGGVYDGSSKGSGNAGSIVKFLCEPELDFKLKITAGLAAVKKPPKPKCTLSKARKNWDEFVRSENFLQDFDTYWDISNNDLGVALSIFSDSLANEATARRMAELERVGSGGFKNVTDKSGKILAPYSIAESKTNEVIEKSTKVEETTYPEIFADAIVSFARALGGQLLDKWIKKGLGGDDDNNDYNWIDQTKTGGGSLANKKGERTIIAKERFAKLFEPQTSSDKIYSIVAQLTLCPDLSNPGPTECVIDDKFAQAITEELTVQEAIDKGLLRKDIPFGYLADGLEPSYKQGYPYRNLIILRKYRIIPVGWELAALNISKNEAGKTFNIQDIINDFNVSGSRFKGLIDPDWVLKSPELYCSMEGFGEKITSTEILPGLDSNKDGDFLDDNETHPKLVISRDKYCADEKTCVKEDDKGNCLFYGYCTEEKRLFNFEGEQCEPQFNSCQTFVGADNKEVSYTKTSLSYEDCNADNAGCTSYCASRNLSDNNWKCARAGWDLGVCSSLTGCSALDSFDIDQDGDRGVDSDDVDKCTIPAGGVECKLEDSKARLTTENAGIALVRNTDNDMYLDASAGACTAKSEGCHEYIRTKPNLGTNLLLNSSFEGFDQNRDGDILDVGELSYFWDGPLGSVNSSEAYTGSNSWLSAGGSTLRNFSAVETGYSLSERKFVASLYAKGTCASASFRFYADDGGSIYSYSGDDIISETIALENSDNWKRYNVAYTFPYFVPAFIQDITVQIGNPATIPAGCYIDAVQLEELSGANNSPSSFTEYQTNNELFLKTAPAYYECEKYVTIADFGDKASCEGDGKLWREKSKMCVEGGSALCENFALHCTVEDIGCNMYTPTNGDPGVPGIVSTNDYCPAVCNGYDTYKQSSNFFSLEKFPEYLIPTNEAKCSAKEEGCSEFTNLNKLEEGGEALEYYTYLRPCKAIDGSCATFYTWVGSDVTGFQLKAFLLEDGDFDGMPDELLDSSIPLEKAKADEMYGICDTTTVITNPNCYEFYSETEIISQVVYKNTKTCSKDCNAYRKTKSTVADCGAMNNWGDWTQLDTDNADGDDLNTTGVDIEYCQYDGLPAESVACSASKDRCFEYKGNTSNNIRNIVESNFEDGMDSWKSLDAGIALSLSSESLSRGGHSMKINSGSITDRFMYPLKSECHILAACTLDEGCECKIAGNTVCSIAKDEDNCIYKSSLINGRSYMVSFWGKGSGDVSVKFSSAASGDEFATGDISLSSEWREYSIGPVFIHDSWNMGSETVPTYAGNDLVVIPEEWIREILEFSGFIGESYLDNIVLKEIRDNLFLIRPDSEVWNIPEVCNQDNEGNFAPQFTLGCKEYTSKIDKNKVYLKSFDHLCSEDVIGCEAMIDTANSDNPIEQIFTSSPSDVLVSADKVVTLVNDKTKQCKSEEKGCNAYGVSQYKYNQNLTFNTGAADEGRGDDADNLFKFETKYVINNPDKYNESLCDSTVVGCGEFKTVNNGSFYFRDPLAQRAAGSPVTCEYKKVPSSAVYGWYIKGTLSEKPNCPLSSTPTGIEFPTASFVTDAKMNWAGECAAEKNSCTEYLDPMSTISYNIVSNGDFSSKDISGGTNNWILNGLEYVYNKTIILEPQTTYTVMGDAPGIANRITLFDCNGVLTSPDDSMTYDFGTDEIYIESTAIGQFSGRFYTNGVTNCKGLKISQDFIDSGISDGIKILKTGLYYYVNNTIDTTACDGIVGYDGGCVLFNKREVGNTGELLTLNYDTDKNDRTNVTPTICIPGSKECDSNTLIKVKPDRTCGEWLSCGAGVIIKDVDNNEKVSCTDVSICNKLDNDGVCISSPENLLKNMVVYDTVDLEKLNNKTGMVELGVNWIGAGFASGFVPGMYPFDKMTQTKSKTQLDNGDFEIITDGVPNSWYVGDDGGIELIDSPVKSQSMFGSVFAPSGKIFVGIGATQNITSSMINIDEDVGEYLYFSAYIYTDKMSSGSALISILEYDINGDPIGTPSVPVDVITQGITSSWHQLFGKYEINSVAKKIKIQLRGQIPAQGKIYFDNIKINPVLKTALNLSGDEDFSAQSCRVYPKSDSLSCSYIDDSDIRNVGKSGYCLRYDTLPGNKKQCLIWWPIDIVSGETTYSDDSYVGRSNLFYCLHADNDIEFVERRVPMRVFYKKGSCGGGADSSREKLERSYNGKICDGCGCSNVASSSLSNAQLQEFSCPSGYTFELRTWRNRCSGIRRRHFYEGWCQPNIQDFVKKDPVTGYNWYRYNGDLQRTGNPTLGIFNEGNWNNATGISDPDPVRIYSYKTDEISIVDDYQANCNTIARVVTAVGDNVAWRERTEAGSTFILGYGTADYNFNTFYKPFGSIMPIEEDDPTEWTAKLKGSPLTCTGRKCNNIGFCSKTGKFCLDTSSGDVCSASSSFNKASIPEFECINDEDVSDGICILSASGNLGVQDPPSNGGQELAKRIFAQSYGIWQISGNSYVADSNPLNGWEPPKHRCAGNPPERVFCGGMGCLSNNPGCNPVIDTDPVSLTCDYCGIPPRIKNVLINGSVDESVFPKKFVGLTGIQQFSESTTVKLSFNTIVDSNQSPVVMYMIDWGDGTTVLGSGVSINDRPNLLDPHIFSKNYSYFDMLTKSLDNPGGGIACGKSGDIISISGLASSKSIQCVGSDCCMTNIKIKIKDNWGWCNGSKFVNDCSNDYNWEYYPGYIIVNQTSSGNAIVFGGCSSNCSGKAIGDTQCSGTTSQLCVGKADGCLEWQDISNCAAAPTSGGSCSNGACIKSCTNTVGCNYQSQDECDFTGADENNIYTCIVNAQGCLVQQSKTSCNTGLGLSCYGHGKCGEVLYNTGMLGAHTKTDCEMLGGTMDTILGNKICSFANVTECPVDWAQYGNYFKWDAQECGSDNGATFNFTHIPSASVQCPAINFAPSCTNPATGSNCTTVANVWTNSTPSCPYTSCEITETSNSSASCATVPGSIDCFLIGGPYLMPPDPTDQPGDPAPERIFADHTCFVTPSAPTNNTCTASIATHIACY